MLFPRMAAKILLTIKFVFLWTYSFGISPVAQMVVQAAEIDNRHPPEGVFWLFIGMVFLPEVLLVFFKGFRNWIKEGLEDGDGKLSKKDLKDLLPYYSSLNSLRIFVLSSLLMMFYDVHIEFQYYIIPFLGSLGLAGIEIIKKTYLRKK